MQCIFFLWYHVFMNITLPTEEWNAQAWYNEHAKTYFDSTLTLDMSSQYSLLAPYFQAGQTLLDIGCGSGRDAAYWAQQGCIVHAVDTSDGMIALAKETHAQLENVTFDHMDMLSLPLTHRYDNMMACASLLHIPEHHYTVLFKHFNEHLQVNGHFYASWKVADGGFDAQGRFFTNYPTWGKLAKMLEQVIPFDWTMVSYQTGQDSMGRAVGWHECLWKKRT